MAASAVAFALLRLPLYPLLLRATRYPPLSAPCSLLSILCCCWPRGGHWCIAFWSGQIIARIILCHILKSNEFVASSAPSSLLLLVVAVLFVVALPSHICFVATRWIFLVGAMCKAADCTARSCESRWGKRTLLAFPVIQWVFPFVRFSRTFVKVLTGCSRCCLWLDW